MLTVWALEIQIGLGWESILFHETSTWINQWYSALNQDQPEGQKGLPSYTLCFGKDYGKAFFFFSMWFQGLSTRPFTSRNAWAFQVRAFKVAKQIFLRKDTSHSIPQPNNGWKKVSVISFIYIGVPGINKGGKR